MANAFFILGIVMAIFAVVAFDLFADRDDLNFGSFSRAYFTMFQVCVLWEKRGCGGRKPPRRLSIPVLCACLTADTLHKSVRACARTCVRVPAFVRARRRHTFDLISLACSCAPLCHRGLPVPVAPYTKGEGPRLLLPCLCPYTPHPPPSSRLRRSAPATPGPR